MKRTYALLTFIAIFKKFHLTPKYEPSDSEITHWIEIAQNATELTNEEIEGDAGLYRLGAEYCLCAEAYEQFMKEEASDYASVYG